MAELPLSSQVGPQVWRTVANEHNTIAQNSMWLFVACSPLSDALLLSVIVLDCVGLQNVGGRLLWACLGGRLCELVQDCASSTSIFQLVGVSDSRSSVLSSACHHMLEGVPYCSSHLSYSRSQGVVAVVLFFRIWNTGWNTFLTAPMEQLISLSFFRTSNLTFVGDPFSIAKRMAFQGDWIRYPCHPARKKSMSATRASDVYPHGPNCEKECRDFDWRSLTGNFELRLIKVCGEVGMRSCFLLTAAIAIRQERLPSLLVDPACMLKLAWCKHMQGKTFASAEIEGSRRFHVAATTVDIPRTVVASHGAHAWCSSLFSSSLELSHGLVMSLDRQRAAHSEEHRLTAFMKALLHVSVSPDNLPLAMVAAPDFGRSCRRHANSCKSCAGAMGTVHDVPAVQADILTLHKLLHQQQGDRRSNSIGRMGLQSDGSHHHLRQRRRSRQSFFFFR